jgi:hypothetical protein
MSDSLTSSMDSVDAINLGTVAKEVGTQTSGIGDSIDRGLILRRRLEEEGYLLIKAKPEHVYGDSRPTPVVKDTVKLPGSTCMSCGARMNGSRCTGRCG